MGRAVGNLERFSTSRHSLGLYHNVAITARYTSSTSSTGLRNTIELALSKVILQFPALCHGIINEHKRNPEFVLLNTIDIASQILWMAIPATSIAEHDANLIRAMEQTHSRKFPEIGQVAPWRLLILPYNGPEYEEGNMFDAVFTFHHALGDGMSGVAFHRAFLAAMRESQSAETDGTSINVITVAIPWTTKLAPPLEKLINFKISWIFLLLSLWKMLRPAWLAPARQLPWTSTPISAENIKNSGTRVEILSLAPDLISSILAACRAEQSTLTGLLHGLIATSLSAHVPTAETFSSATPFSLRYLTGLSPTDGFGVQVSSISSLYDTSLVTSLRSPADPEKLTEIIWDIARQFKADMSKEIASLPNDNVLGLIPYISDFRKFWLEKIGKPRDNTYELSNVGVLKPKDQDSEHGWNTEKVVFTQSGMSTGAGLGINVASVMGGILSISFTWLEHDIDEDLVEKIMKDVDFGLKCVGAGKHVSLNT